MALHIYPVTIKGVSPPIHCLLSRPTTEFRPAPTVIYFHGLNGSRNQIFQDRYSAFANAMQELGCNLLSFELRAHGERRDDKKITALENMLKTMNQEESNPFDGMIDDIKKAIAFLVEKQIALPSQIAVAGLSWGALFAMYALQLEHRVKCGIALLPVGKISQMIEFKRMKEHPLIQKYEPMLFSRNMAPKPLLMISAEKDTRVDARYAGELYEKLYPDYVEANAPENLVYRMLLGVGHSYDARMTDMTVDWLKKHLLVERDGPMLD